MIGNVAAFVGSSVAFNGKAVTRLAESSRTAGYCLFPWTGTSEPCSWVRTCVSAP
jgi:hypothetical protein